MIEHATPAPESVEALRARLKDAEKARKAAEELMVASATLCDVLKEKIARLLKVESKPKDEEAKFKEDTVMRTIIREYVAARSGTDRRNEGALRQGVQFVLRPMARTIFTGKALSVEDVVALSGRATAKTVRRQMDELTRLAKGGGKFEVVVTGTDEQHWHLAEKTVE
jgi:hypothetical protein